MYLVYYPPIVLVILFIVHGIIKEEKKVIVYNSLLGALPGFSELHSQFYPNGPRGRRYKFFKTGL
jgi:hypothetical protein